MSDRARSSHLAVLDVGQGMCWDRAPFALPIDIIHSVADLASEVAAMRLLCVLLVVRSAVADLTFVVPKPSFSLVPRTLVVPDQSSGAQGALREAARQSGWAGHALWVIYTNSWF